MVAVRDRLLEIAWRLARRITRPAMHPSVFQQGANAQSANEPSSGSSLGDSCNFPGPSRVVESNDEPPVHTSPSRLIAPTDFATFMRNYQNMVFSTAARLTGNDAQAED